MRVLQIYNQQRSVGGGEERVVLDTVALLREGGVDVKLHMATSRGIETSLTNRLRAAGSTIYSRSAYQAAKLLIEEFRPDVAHAHNLYPLFSPSVLVACRELGVPVVFSVHSQILTCPTWHHEYEGKICERCVGGKEYWCVIQNCRSHALESTLYAVRSAFTRIRGLFHDNVTIFVTMSPFMRDRLTAQGYPLERVALLPNMVRVPAQAGEPRAGEYVGFAGRLSTEKGLSVLMDAARLLPSVPFRIAGGGPLHDSLVRSSPPNVSFLGYLEREEIGSFYRSARMVTLPSVTFEGGPLVALEAMAHGVPIVASRLGSLPDVVEDGLTGRLFEPGDSRALAGTVDDLWSNPSVASTLGARARGYVQELHNPEVFYKRTIEIYQRAIDMNASGMGFID